MKPKDRLNALATRRRRRIDRAIKADMPSYIDHALRINATLRRPTQP